MRERPPYLPSRETLESYLCALIPPSITTLDEEVHFLEEEFVRVAEKAMAEQMLRVGEWGHEATKARHARELEKAVAEARIEEIVLYADSGDDVLDHLAALRAALAALDMEVKGE